MQPKEREAMYVCIMKRMTEATLWLGCKCFSQYVLMSSDTACVTSTKPKGHMMHIHCQISNNTKLVYDVWDVKKKNPNYIIKRIFVMCMYGAW